MGGESRCAGKLLTFYIAWYHIEILFFQGTLVDTSLFLIAIHQLSIPKMSRNSMLDFVDCSLLLPSIPLAAPRSRSLIVQIFLPDLFCRFPPGSI